MVLLFCIQKTPLPRFCFHHFFLEKEMIILIIITYLLLLLWLRIWLFRKNGLIFHFLMLLLLIICLQHWFLCQPGLRICFQTCFLLRLHFQNLCIGKGIICFGLHKRLFFFLLYPLPRKYRPSVPISKMLDPPPALLAYFLQKDKPPLLPSNTTEMGDII